MRGDAEAFEVVALENHTGVGGSWLEAYPNFDPAVQTDAGEAHRRSKSVLVIHNPARSKFMLST
jgi:hypothetical protein